MPPSNPALPEPASPNPAREDLLDRVIGYAATHGLADQSLREIAEGVGSSHRMLLYHFGSREGLVAAIVTRVEADQRVLLADLAARHTEPAALIRAQWALLTDPSTLPYVRLFYELAGLAVHARPGTERFRAEFVAPWLATGQEAAAAVGAAYDEPLTRAGIALTRGLLLDVALTGELAAATAALERYLLLAGSPSK